MTWLDQRWAAFDVESTGVDVFTDRIVQASVVFVGGDQETVIRQLLIASPIDIPEAATRIHGITTEKSRADGADPATSVDLIAGELCLAWHRGMPVVAFNASFDNTMLAAELRRYGLPSLEDRLGRNIGPVLDPYIVDKHISRRKGKRRLEDQCAYYDVKIDGAHDSTHDAIAAARVMWRIGTRNPKIADRALAQLHEDQIMWAAEQAASFRDWLGKQGKPTGDINGDWPLRPYKAEGVAA